MAELDTLNKIFEKLEAFVKGACHIKLKELFPGADDNSIETTANRLLPACICIKSRITMMPSFNSSSITILAGQQSVSPTDKILAMEAFCYQLSKAVDLYYLAVGRGEYGPEDFLKHTLDGQGES